MNNIDTYEIALHLYNLSCDMDFMDYEEVKDQTIVEIENCLYYLKTVAQNKYNDEYFRTFLKCLETITNNR
jgi:hypothetical protein